MKEYGSDFHYIKRFNSVGKTLSDYYPSANYYADGRQALIHLYKSQGWDRLWIPEYFCYDVIQSLKETGLNLMFYTDLPDNSDDNETLYVIQNKGLFRPTDAILRVNYFGMRSYRSSDELSVAAVIEDHTHDLIGDWSLNSTADWCIASLRKSLPIPEGGILWSPKGLKLPESPASLEKNKEVASIRWNAMELKARYLAGDDLEKSSFRSGYVDTEPFFDTCDVCALDKRSLEYLLSFDIDSWYQRKLENWRLLSELKHPDVRILRPENANCDPFSLVLVFSSHKKRDKVRKALIENNVYSAILWNIPAPTDGDVFTMSSNMLSIHCDARYSTKDIEQLKLIIQKVLEL